MVSTFVFAAGAAQAQSTDSPPPAPVEAQTTTPSAPAPEAGKVAVPSPPPDAALPVVEPIIGDEEFNRAIPSLDVAEDPELNRPLE
jgi:translocation and assembly module TamA